jgi:hypothetical protein
MTASDRVRERAIPESIESLAELSVSMLFVDNRRLSGVLGWAFRPIPRVCEHYCSVHFR